MKEAQWWPLCPTMEMTKSKQEELSSAIDTFISKIFDAWKCLARQHRDSGKLLDVPLFCRNIHRHEILECNLRECVTVESQNIPHYGLFKFLRLKRR